MKSQAYMGYSCRISLVVKLDLCSTEGTVGALDLRIHPLHEAVVMENVLARRFTNHR